MSSSWGSLSPTFTRNFIISSFVSFFVPEAIYSIYHLYDSCLVPCTIVFDIHKESSPCHIIKFLNWTTLIKLCCPLYFFQYYVLGGSFDYWAINLLYLPVGELFLFLISNPDKILVLDCIKRFDYSKCRNSFECLLNFGAQRKTYYMIKQWGTLNLLIARFLPSLWISGCPLNGTLFSCCILLSAYLLGPT